MNKYIFMYELDNGAIEGFEFIDAYDETDTMLNNEIYKFIQDKPNISKLITVHIKHTQKIPIELYKEISP